MLVNDPATQPCTSNTTPDDSVSMTIASHAWHGCVLTAHTLVPATHAFMKAVPVMAGALVTRLARLIAPLNVTAPLNDVALFTVPPSHAGPAGPWGPAGPAGPAGP